jgi:hypothetical protein
VDEVGASAARVSLRHATEGDEEGYEPQRSPASLDKGWPGHEPAARRWTEGANRSAIRRVSPYREVTDALIVRPGSKYEGLIGWFWLARSGPTWSRTKHSEGEDEDDEERPKLQKSNLARKRRSF